MNSMTGLQARVSFIRDPAAEKLLMSNVGLISQVSASDRLTGFQFF